MITFEHKIIKKEREWQKSAKIFKHKRRGKPLPRNPLFAATFIHLSFGFGCYDPYNWVKEAVMEYYMSRRGQNNVCVSRGLMITGHH